MTTSVMALTCYFTKIKIDKSKQVAHLYLTVICVTYRT